MNFKPNQPPTSIEETRPAKRPYTPPAIFCELQLEIRAGSPLGIPDMFNEFKPSQ